MRHRLLLAIPLLALAGCDADPDITRRAGSPGSYAPPTQTERITVETHHVSYGAIHIVSDAKTGREYIVAFGGSGGADIKEILPAAVTAEQ